MKRFNTPEEGIKAITFTASLGRLQDRQSFQLQPGDRFIKLGEVQQITGRKKSQIYADPTFPRPIKLSKRESAWIDREVQEWMQSRVNAARGAV